MTHLTYAGVHAIARMLRDRMEPAFRPDTAAAGNNGLTPSSGHCAVAAMIVHELLGGSYMSCKVDAVSHWYNRVEVVKSRGPRMPPEESLFDVDLTGDQFPQFARVSVHIYPADAAEDVKWEARVRSPSDLNAETKERATRLWSRMGFRAKTSWEV